MRAKVFTEAQAANQMLVSPETLARWRREGMIKHYRQMGRLIRYTPEDIDLNIAERSSTRPRPVNEQKLTEARFG